MVKLRQRRFPYDGVALKAWLEDIAASGFVDEVSITGGEPFLVFPRLIDVTGRIARAGLRASVVSSGFWAVDGRRSRDRLARLAGAGLGTLYLSISPYHQQQVPTRHLRCALEEALGEGIEVGILLYQHEHTERSAAVRQLRTLLGRELVDRVRYLNCGQILAMGAARQELPAGAFPPSAARDLCTAIGPVLFPDGEVSACCGEPLPPASPLVLGDLSREPFEVVLRRLRSSPVLPFLIFLGFRRTEDLLRESGLRVTARARGSPQGPCQRCATLAAALGSHRTLALQLLHRHRREISLKQLLLYGEQVFDGLG